MKLVIVFLYCLLCFALMLQASPVDAEVTAASATGSISGKVTDAIGAGIQYVTVYVQEYNSSAPSIYYLSVMTEADGSYTVSDLQTGNYKVRFDGSSAGYIPYYYTNTADPNSATPVVVTAPNTTPDINAVLVQGGRISGKVTDAAGSGMPDVTVTLQDSSGSGIDYLYSTPVMTTTDGSYTVSGLRTGSYKVGFSSSGYVMRYYSHAVSSADATPVQVTAPATISGIDCQFTGGSISGRVTDGSGSSLTNSGIIAYNEYDEMIGYGTTDQNGAYLLRGFPDGTYKIYFDGSTAGYVGTYYNNKSDMAEADPVTISGAAEKTGINAVLNKGGSISGTVTDNNGNALHYVMVEVYDFKGNPMTSNMTMPIFSDFQGNYTVKGIPTGSFKVHFTPRLPSSASGQWYRNKMGFAAADTVAVTAPGDTAITNAVLGDGPDIHVTPPAKDFGTVTVNTSSVRSFTIVSDGTSDLTLGTIAITGSNTANFSLKNDLCSGKTLPPSTLFSSTSCTFQVQFSPQSVGVKNASISIPSNDPDTQTTVISLTGYGDPGPTAVLCVTMSGTGGGSVHTDPPGISCTSGKCCAPLNLGDQVTMMAKPDVFSIFGGWSGTGAGTCAGHTGDCSLTVNGASDLTATFNLMSPVRIFSATPAYYTKLQNAYDAAQEGATIQAMAHDFTETLDFNHSVKVRLTGGYDGSYTTNAGKTVVHGTLIIRQGTVTVENLLIE